MTHTVVWLREFGAKQHVKGALPLKNVFLRGLLGMVWVAACTHYRA